MYHILSSILFVSMYLSFILLRDFNYYRYNALDALYAVYISCWKNGVGGRWLIKKVFDLESCRQDIWCRGRSVEGGWSG